MFLQHLYGLLLSQGCLTLPAPMYPQKHLSFPFLFIEYLIPQISHINSYYNLWLYCHKLITDYLRNLLSLYDNKYIEYHKVIFWLLCANILPHMMNHVYSNARCIIELISRSEPVTELIQFCLLDITLFTEMETMNQPSDGASTIPDSLMKIYNKIPVLKKLFQSFNTEFKLRNNSAFTQSYLVCLG